MGANTGLTVNNTHANDDQSPVGEGRPSGGAAVSQGCPEGLCERSRLSEGSEWSRTAAGRNLQARISTWQKKTSPGRSRRGQLEESPVLLVTELPFKGKGSRAGQAQALRLS